jgi:hypothetical protein
VHLRTQTIFLLLIVSQALHSVEEYVFQLWEVLAPARLISSLIADDLPVGFAIANSTIVAFGLWCYFWPIRQKWRSATVFMWFWALLELGNSIGHILFAVLEEGYFPGVYTAPILLILSVFLLHRLHKHRNVSFT